MPRFKLSPDATAGYEPAALDAHADISRENAARCAMVCVKSDTEVGVGGSGTRLPVRYAPQAVAIPTAAENGR